MANKSRTGFLISLGAAAGAFGTAAMMAAVGAPSANADDFTDVISQVEYDYGLGTTDLGDAQTDFGGSDLTDGLAALYSGIDEDVLNGPQDFLIGTSELASNESLEFPESEFFSTVTSLSQGFSYAEEEIEDAQGYFSEAASALGSGEYGYASYDFLLGADYSSIFPLQEILLGAASSL
jgi:hypothetical protein